MKKKSSFSAQGTRADIGDLEIYRMLPNRYADAVGPFVFLDHIAPKAQPRINKEGTGAHPHRGIATLTYIINGKAEHFDSAGNHAIVHSGGVQWMNAGNGIIHDETLNADSGLLHALQFWINLPAAIKAQSPSYLAIQGSEVPFKALPDEKGWIKVIAGSFEELKSAIPQYSEQFLYHIRLQPGSTFAIEFQEKTEVAAHLPLLPATINDEKFISGDFIEFDKAAGTIAMSNEQAEACDIILFGGAPYLEPIFADGPFVMNSQQEIAQAYLDFHHGKYGSIR